MFVMNDRSAGGSAYRNGTLELAINRRMNTSDDLGNDEVLNETYPKTGAGLRTLARYTLTFTKSRETAFGVIRKHYVLSQHPLQVFTAIQRLSEDSIV
jgi:hypothetical protein